MTWAMQRQIVYIGVLLAFFLGLAFLVGYPYFNKPPTCFDNKQNGEETGVDCGGGCALACIAQVDPVSILWSRAFRVVPGRYNAVAYLENHNKNSAIERVSYKFRFADKDNVYIGKREGVAFIPTAGRFAIFEPAIDVGNSIPVYTTFEFTETPVYTQVEIEKLNQLKIIVSNIELENETTAPHLSAQIKNNSLFNIPELGVVAILYDETGNAVSVSRTYLDQLSGGESKELNFTWPEPITDKVIAQEIIPMYNIFAVKLK
jgi:hypothetical protein